MLNINKVPSTGTNIQLKITRNITNEKSSCKSYFKKSLKTTNKETE